MELELLFGRGLLEVRLPDDLDVTVIRKPAMPVLPSTEAGVAAALAGPVAARPLREEARGARSACRLVCDITRPVPNRLLLGPIVRELLEAGVPRERITVPVATGLHRPNLGAELEELIGDPWECSEGMGSREYVEAQRRLLAQGPEGFLAGIAGKPFADAVEAAVAESVRRSGDRAVAVIPEGPYVLPALAAAAPEAARP